jgi:hypothetical protein
MASAASGDMPPAVVSGIENTRPSISVLATDSAMLEQVAI